MKHYCLSGHFPTGLLSNCPATQSEWLLMEIVWKWQINLHAGLKSKILWLRPRLLVKEKERERKKTLRGEDELTH